MKNNVVDLGFDGGVWVYVSLLGQDVVPLWGSGLSAEASRQA